MIQQGCLAHKGHSLIFWSAWAYVAKQVELTNAFFCSASGAGQGSIDNRIEQAMVSLNFDNCKKKFLMKSQFWFGWSVNFLQKNYFWFYHSNIQDKRYVHCAQKNWKSANPSLIQFWDWVPNVSSCLKTSFATILPKNI